MNLVFDFNPRPTSYVLSRENSEKIVGYFKRQQNVQVLENLISSLEASVRRKGVPESHREAEDYHGGAVYHTSRVFQGGAVGWEGGEHEDDEVDLPLPDLKERSRGKEWKKDRQKQKGEAERRYRIEGEVKTAAVGLYPTLPTITQDIKGPKGVSFFESGEHDDEEVTVQGKIADKNVLTLPNGIQLAYGEIIAFAGDFYGIPEMPICEEKSGTSYESRFMDAFDTLGRGDLTTINKELSQIREILKIEKNSVATVLGRGDPSIPTVLDEDKAYNQPSDVYKHHGLWFTIQYDTILGGRWVKGVPLKFGRMMKLAENNPDHFQPYSRKVWEVGHKIALRKAEEAKLIFKAKREEAVNLLHEAYAISAFSCHFLTDSFAAGHIRLDFTFTLQQGISG